MNRNLALTTLGVLSVATVFAAPASATTFDLRYAYEIQSWNVPGTGSTAMLGFTAPLHTYTVTDHSGSVLSFGAAMARTESGRMRARDEAIRRRDTSYSYAIHSAQPKEGLLLGMTVGTGQPANFSGSAVSGGTPVNTSANLLKFFMGSDLFSLFDGTLAWDTAAWGMSATDPSGVGTNQFSFKSSMWALGLTYRIPVLTLPILIEPYAHLDLGRAIGSGFTSYDSRDYGATLAYVLHPQWRVEARLHNATMASELRGGATTSGLANLTTTAFGTTMTF